MNMKSHIHFAHLDSKNQDSIDAINADSALLQECLITASKQYYEYLKAHNLGLSPIYFFRYELKDSTLIFTLKGISDMDMRLSAKFLLQVGNADSHRIYEITEGGDIEVGYYDEKLKVLLLNLSPAAEKALQKAIEQKCEIKLFSDLTFLVKNVETFFENFGLNLALPNAIESVSVPYIERLSKEQNAALNIVLNRPLSYVWGPPGTGKTQAVLFEALLHYAKLNKRVAVIAATNNALEQVLVTLIKQFDELKFNRHNILRLGTPTISFLNAYPQSCEPSVIKNQNTANLFNFEENLQNNSLKNRLKNALVIGVTLDGFIKKYESLELRFHHIFLDECAYAPLIKTCALCVDNTPLAFFGDHKQLSPVCEMPQNELKLHKESFVWNLSALFLESFCAGENVENLAFNYETKGEIPLKFTKMSQLSKTHRYGNNLAEILDKHIYHIGLEGNGSQMELFVIDSGSKDKTEMRLVSENEAKVCERLCQRLSGEEYAVITPFKKQRERLARSINKERVFTIHGSQGREFDNVIFSPVILHFHLTDSTKAQALFALNVAISRIKKRLFIVCDYAFWNKAQNQLISSILRQSKLLKI